MLRTLSFTGRRLAAVVGVTLKQPTQAPSSNSGFGPDYTFVEGRNWIDATKAVDSLIPSEFLDSIRRSEEILARRKGEYLAARQELLKERQQGGEAGSARLRRVKAEVFRLEPRLREAQLMLREARLAYMRCLVGRFQESDLVARGRVGGLGAPVVIQSSDWGDYSYDADELRRGVARIGGRLYTSLEIGEAIHFFPGSNSRVQSQVPVRRDDALHFETPPGAPRFVLYGPHVTLESGDYETEVGFTLEKLGLGWVRIEVCSDQGSKIYVRHSCSNRELANGLVRCSYRLPDKAHEVEIRLEVPGRSSGSIKTLSFSRVCDPIRAQL